MKGFRRRIPCVSRIMKVAIWAFETAGIEDSENDELL